MAAALQDMLDQVNSHRRPKKLWKRQRSLKARLRLAIRWLDLTLGAPAPDTVEEAELFVMGLYELEELLPQLVDDFHRLMEATGEEFPV